MSFHAKTTKTKEYKRLCHMWAKSILLLKKKKKSRLTPYCQTSIMLMSLCWGNNLILNRKLKRKNNWYKVKKELRKWETQDNHFFSWLWHSHFQLSHSLTHHSTFKVIQIITRYWWEDFYKVMKTVS